jgi:antitoxin component YwqK of YwqJK toxin-antitoxin module
LGLCGAFQVCLALGETSGDNMRLMILFFLFAISSCSTFKEIVINKTTYKNNEICDQERHRYSSKTNYSTQYRFSPSGDLLLKVQYSKIQNDYRKISTEYYRSKKIRTTFSSFEKNGIHYLLWSSFSEKGQSEIVQLMTNFQTMYFKFPTHRFSTNDDIVVLKFGDGRAREIIHFSNGVLHGNWLSYYENSQLQSDVCYHNGVVVGVSKYFHFDGTLSGVEQYDETGAPSGEWAEYYPNGVMRIRSIFSNRERVLFEEFSITGIPLTKKRK